MGGGAKVIFLGLSMGEGAKVSIIRDKYWGEGLK